MLDAIDLTQSCIREAPLTGAMRNRYQHAALLRQGKPGKSLTAPFPFNDAECPATLFVKYLAKN